MRKERNLIAIIIALSLLLVGILMILGDVFWWKTYQYVFVSIACSLIASGLVLLLTSLFLDVNKTYEVWERWRLERIFKTRADKNADSDPKLEAHKVKNLDVIAFGLSSFRSFHTPDVQNCLNHGAQVRILAMDPEGAFIGQREAEEHDASGHIGNSIQRLTEWARELNQHSTRGQVQVKYYACMTLDFYWRIDDEIYIGPYLYGKESQQTITYKFVKGGLGYDLYAEYFEELWSNTEIVRQVL